MKAILFRQHGGPEVLQYTDAPTPSIRANEVLVRVRACALNHLDLWVRGGLPNVPIPLPHIPGSDIAGEIAEIGADVTTVKVGQKVVLAPGVSCGKCAACLAGRDNFCRQFSNLGYMIDGGCAEFVKCPEVNCLPYPENLTFEQAAAIPLVFQTAWHMLLTRAQLQPGEDVLILGAGSGVGSAAIQIAAHVRSAHHRHRRQQRQAGKSQAARRPSPHQSQNAKNPRRSPPHHQQTRSRRRLRTRRHRHLGRQRRQPRRRRPPHHLRRNHRLRRQNRSALPLHPPTLATRLLHGRQIRIATVMKLVASGHLKPVIDRTFPLASCADAHRYLESGDQFGKVVLTV